MEENLSEQEPRSGIDVLTLFREDLDQADRIQLFKEQAEILRSDVDMLASQEMVDYINTNYDITFIFNSHGTGIDAAQSLRETKEPFLTFIEAAEAPDVQKSHAFMESVENRFRMEFDGQPSSQPGWQPQNEGQAFAYWQYRGLLAKGSIVAPVDVRYYSARMLDALIGDKYDQDYLNRYLNSAAFHQVNFDGLLQEARNHGELVMYSNAVRELTTTRQVLQMLSALGNNEALRDLCGSEEIGNKLAAVTDKARRDNDKLPIYIHYGTAHHGAMHELRTRGIQASRVFAGETNHPESFKYAGAVMDQFFNAHHFDVNSDQLDTYARHYLLASLLLAPMYEAMSYGVFPANNDERNTLFSRVQRIARDKMLIADIENIVNDFKTDPSVPVKILQAHGVSLIAIND